MLSLFPHLLLVTRCLRIFSVFILVLVSFLFRNRAGNDLIMFLVETLRCTTSFRHPYVGNKSDSSSSI